MNLDEVLLAQTALVHIERLRSHLETRQVTPEIRLDAVSLRLSSMVEVCSQLPVETRNWVFGGMWNEAWGMRNRIAHSYHWFSAEPLQQVVDLHLDDIEQRLHALSDS